jgi:hypothetical protein
VALGEDFGRGSKEIKGRKPAYIFPIQFLFNVVHLTIILSIMFHNVVGVGTSPQVFLQTPILLV